MKRSLVPGVAPAAGIFLLALGAIVLLPLSAVVFKGLGRSFWETVTEPRVLASLRLSLLASLASAAAVTLAGFFVAWVLARYQFPGRRAVDAIIDLPFAMPTAVAGIALTTLYANSVAYTPVGIGLAMAFVGLPFAVRTVQPVIQDLDPELEQAAASLGASPRQTFFRVILPALRPAIIAGFTLAFARALGEYGSVVFIAGNMPMKTEIAPLLIMTKLEQYDYAGASAVATVMLAGSLLLLAAIHALQGRARP